MQISATQVAEKHALQTPSTLSVPTTAGLKALEYIPTVANENDCKKNTSPKKAEQQGRKQACLRYASNPKNNM
jgi:hypothetical protein